MLKAKRKRVREEQQSMDVDVKLEDTNCSSQSSHPTKRACVDLVAGNVRVLKEEDPVDISTHVPTEVSKLDPPAVKRPPARYVAFGAAKPMRNASGVLINRVKMKRKKR